MMPVFGLERPDWLWALLLAVPLIALAYATRRKVSRLRLGLATATRVALMASLVLALAGLTRYSSEEALGVVFVLDRSASLGPDGIRRGEEFVREALKSQGRDDLAGVVTFGADALVEKEAVEELLFEGVETVPVPHQTDIASGIRLASALLPSNRTRRIVLLSDGEETRGDASAQVLLTAGDDLQIAVVPLPRASGPEILLEDLLAPPRVDEGAAYEVRVVARSELAASGKLRLYRNDDYLGELPVKLTGGRSDVFSFRQEATAAGLLRYRAVFEPDDPSTDGIPQNNEVVSTVQITGRPRVLVVDTDPTQMRFLVKVLEQEGFVVDLIPPANLPSGPAGFRPYAAVVLSDVPAYVMSRRQQDAVQSYVRDLGRGLVMIGGEHSFGLGGYYETPIEAALPVNVDLKDKTRFPKLGMVIAMDKSCSMGDGAGSKLGMAKEAGIQTAELLSKRDMLGVIAFDGAASFLVPLVELDDKQQVISRIASIRSGGGTDIYPAMDRAIRGLKATDASLKHIILLSDGITAGGDFQTLITDAHRNDKITVTSIAIGDDADRSTMQEFAQWGGGNYYLVTDPTAIPSIFTRETMLASRSFLVEGAFVPTIAAPSDVLKGLRQADMPQLYGYVATEAKPRAVVPLLAPDPKGGQNLPVLAHWRYGLGRSSAFTSDAKARWARDWVGTESYTRMWSQLLRWTAGDTNADALEVEAEIREGELVVTVDAFDDAGAFRNFLKGEARVVAPDLTVRPVELRQVAPGRYQGAVPVDQDGSWLVGVSMTAGDVVVGQAVAEAVQPYSPEYRSHGAGAAVLTELGKLGGGGVLAAPADAFRRPEIERMVPNPLWPALLALSGFLLLADVAVRRLELGGGPRRGVVTLDRPVPAPAPRPVEVPTGPAPDLHVETPVALEDEASEPAEEKAEEGAYVGGLLAARQKARKRMNEKEDA